MLPLLLLSIYIINGLLYIPAQSPLSDESAHLNYGIRLLKKQPDKVRPYQDASCMPISAINGLPRAFQQIFTPQLQKSDWGQSDIMIGRYATLFTCILIGLLIFVWAKELYGEIPATFSLALFVFCPNLNAHTGLVTTDAYAALLTISTCYFFYKWQTRHTWTALIFFSVSIGLAQLAKQSLSILFIIFSLLVVYELVRTKRFFFDLKAKACRLALAISIVLLVLNAGFLFRQTFTPLNNYQFVSTGFKKLQANFYLVGAIPLPLPTPYLYGLDQLKEMVEIGAGDERVSRPNYILGENRKREGFWYYYLVIALFKTPLLVVVMIFISIALILSGRMKISNHEKRIWVVIGAFFFFFTLVGRQVGVRHLLVIYPLLYVLVAKVLLLIPEKKRFHFILPGFSYSVASFYFFFPNLLAYSNELVLDKKYTYKIMADSNLDWGQGVFFLNRYLAQHPNVAVAPANPAPGKYIVSVNDMIEGHGNRSFAWVRQVQPKKHVYFCYLLLEIDSAEIKKLKIIDRTR